MLSSFFPFVYLVGLAVSLPVPREVPQEHSHNPQVASVRSSLNLNNPQNLGDPIFGLLGNQAAAQALGDTTDPDCLQQNMADQAFTNAKAANDIDGQVNALIYRALERNTGAVGTPSVACTSVKAVNPEIAAIQQHQDPASPNAAAINKAIVLKLAQQIASVGGDPQDAIKSGTFKPGDPNDPTAAGFTCNDADDDLGCIFSKNLLVPDATPEEIDAAVGGGSGATNSTTTPSGGDGADDSNGNNGGASGAQDNNGQNLQTFAGALGGIPAPPISASGGKFIVEGNEFVNIGAAQGRSCDVQHNKCADLANSADGRSSRLTVSQCDQQDQMCKAAGTSGSAGNGNVNIDVGKCNVNGTTSGASGSAGSGQSNTGSSSAGNSGSSSDQNLQTFTGALGGPAPSVTVGGRGFVVDGSDDFLNVGAAVGRSCDIQHNNCANLANSAAGRSSGLTVAQCDQQDTDCKTAAAAN